MTLKLFSYLFLSILAVGCYHWVHQWFQDSFSYYFTFSKVKTTDKLFDLGVVGVESSHEEDVVVSDVEKEEGKMGEEEVMGREEDLFQFIDGL
jgi:hypothetical protein